MAVVEQVQERQLPLEFSWDGLTQEDAEVLRSALVAVTAQATRHYVRGIVTLDEFDRRVSDAQRLAKSLRAARR